MTKPGGITTAWALCFLTFLLVLSNAGVWMLVNPTRAQGLVVSLVWTGLALACILHMVEAEANHRIASERRRVAAEIDRRLGEFDPAASVFTRSMFEARLNQECARSARYKLSMTVMMLSVQAMPKATGGNDWAAVSSVVVGATARLLRSEDIVGYVGGLEYAFCFPHTDGKGAEIAARRLEKALAELGPAVGVAEYGADGTTAAELLDACRQSSIRRLAVRARTGTWNEDPAVI